MNDTEYFGSLPNTSEPFGSNPQPSEDFGSLPNTSKSSGAVGRGKKYSGAEVPDREYDRASFLIVEEAYAIFESQGERRSVRMIGEYCKTGELICSYDTDDKRWHITRESVEHKIAKIKALNARKAAAAPQHTSEQFTERPAAPQRPPGEVPPQSESAYPPPDDIKKLEQQVIDLKIMNAGKDYLIDQLRKDREELITRVETTSRLVGKLKTRLLQLMPGRPTPGNDTNSLPADGSASPRESKVYRDVEDVSSSHANDPTPSVSPNEPLADNPNNTYEHSPQQS